MRPCERWTNLPLALKCVTFLLHVRLEFFHSRSGAKKEVRTDLAVQRAYAAIKMV